MADQKNELKIECPFCKGKLILDPKSGEIIHKEEAKREKASFDDFLEKRKTRSKDLSDKFGKAQEAQKKRKEMIEKKFKWAKDHEEELPDAKPDINWD